MGEQKKKYKSQRCSGDVDLGLKAEWPYYGGLLAHPSHMGATSCRKYRLAVLKWSPTPQNLAFDLLEVINCCAMTQEIGDKIQETSGRLGGNLASQPVNTWGDSGRKNLIQVGESVQFIL